MNTFTFTNKEEYLAYRSAWKAEYKELSKTIKERKWLRKTWQRAYNKTYLSIGPPWKDGWNNFQKHVQNILDTIPNYNEIYKKHNHKITLESLRKSAKNMNEQLALSKKEAQRQYKETNNI